MKDSHLRIFLVNESFKYKVACILTMSDTFEYRNNICLLAIYKHININSRHRVQRINIAIPHSSCSIFIIVQGPSLVLPTYFIPFFYNPDLHILYSCPLATNLMCLV